MSGWLVWLVTLIYACVAVDQVRHGNVANAVAYAGWAVANTAIYYGMKT